MDRIKRLVNEAFDELGYGYPSNKDYGWTDYGKDVRMYIDTYQVDRKEMTEKKITTVELIVPEQFARNFDGTKISTVKSGKNGERYGYYHNYRFVGGGGKSGRNF